MTVHANDANDITITTAFEASNRCQIRHRNHPDSEIVTQRSQTYALTLKDGATMAWAGLVQCDPKEERHSSLGRLPLAGGLSCKHQAAKRTRETVIFVTAQMIPEFTPPTMPMP